MRWTNIKQCLLIIFLFFSPEVFAQGMFEVLPTDKSLVYLGTIFGGNIGAISLGGGANPLLSKMFEKLNFIVVTFGVVILAYIGIAGAINTAREGEALGKKFSLWVPLRAMMGMLLMVPTPGTGYSAVQMTVIWFVLNGIGAANSIWNVVLDQLASGVKAVGEVRSIEVPDETVNNVTEQVLRAASCMNVLNSIPEFTTKYGRAKIIVNYKPVKLMGNANDPTEMSQDAFVTVGLEKQPNATEDYSNICGSFKVSADIVKDPKGPTFNRASLLTRLSIKVNALLADFSAIDSAATTIATVRPKGTDEPKPQPGYIPAALRAYKQQLLPLATGDADQVGSESYGSGAAARWAEKMWGGTKEAAQKTAEYSPYAAGLVIEGGAVVAGGAAVAGAFADLGSMMTWEKNYEKISIKQDQINDLKRLGWIHAGSYYYALSKDIPVRPDTDAAKPPVPFPDEYKPPSAVDENTIKGTTTAPKGWNQKLFNLLGTDQNRFNLNDALMRSGTYFEGDKTTSSPSLPALGSGKASTGNGFMDIVLTPLADGFRKPIIQGIQDAMSGGPGDPLLKMGKMGWNMMITAEIVLFAGMVAAFVLSTSASPGACLNPFAYSVNWVLTQLFTMVYLLMAMIWSIGATLGIYIPMVPYLIFTSTALGWFIAVIEAVVAAPFIALSLVQPSGEELGNIKQAIGILMNVFLKPSLMIFGFIIAGSLLRATIDMINFGFISAVDGSIIPSLFGIIPIMGLYAFFVIAMVNQSFSLIYELPSKVLRYCGMEDKGGYDPKAAAGEGKAGFEAGEKVAGKEGAIGAASGHAAGATKGLMTDKGKKGGELPGSSPGGKPPGGDKPGDGGDKKSGGDTPGGDKKSGGDTGGNPGGNTGGAGANAGAGGDKGTSSKSSSSTSGASGSSSAGGSSGTSGTTGGGGGDTGGAGKGGDTGGAKK